MVSIKKAVWYIKVMDNKLLNYECTRECKDVELMWEDGIWKCHGVELGCRFLSYTVTT